jgi:hypothetical protein
MFKRMLTNGTGRIVVFHTRTSGAVRPQLGSEGGKSLGIGTLLDPVGAKLGQSARQVDPHVRVGVRTGAVVNRQRKVCARGIY